MTWTSDASAISAAFLASLVEAVEALTIVLAVATVRSWRPAGLGALAGLVLLALIVLLLGPLIGRVPLQALQLVIGILQLDRQHRLVEQQPVTLGVADRLPELTSF